MFQTPTTTEKRPRHYAAEIIALKSRDGRAAALARVPEIFRAWVRDLVEDYYWRRRLPAQPPAAPAEDTGCAPRTAAPVDKSTGQRTLSGLRGRLSASCAGDIPSIPGHKALA